MGLTKVTSIAPLVPVSSEPVSVPHPRPRTSWLSGRFRDESLEETFRAERYTAERLRVVLGVGLTTFASLIFVRSDLVFLTGDPRLMPLLVLRALHLGVALWVIFQMARGLDWRRFDRDVAIWLLATAVLITAVNSTRPAGYAHNNVIDVVVVLLTFILYPAPTWVLAGTNLLLVAGNLLRLLAPDRPAPVLTVVLVSYGVALVLGAVLTRAWWGVLREQYASKVAERKLREALSDALGEIRVLRGIIPICSHCHSVRDEDGAWSRLEEYMRTHTEITFSHGVCRSCLHEHYPEVAHEIDADR